MAGRGRAPYHTQWQLDNFNLLTLTDICQHSIKAWQTRRSHCWDRQATLGRQCCQAQRFQRCCLPSSVGACTHSNGRSYAVRAALGKLGRQDSCRKEVTSSFSSLACL